MHISEKKKKAAAEVLKYLSSKEAQKKYIIPNNYFSGISSLYDDEEVCSMIDCDVAKGAEPFSTMMFKSEFYERELYISKTQEYIYDYLYYNKSLSEIIKKIDNMTKFYTFSIQTDDDTNAGIIIFIMYWVILFAIIINIPFLLLKSFKDQFKILPTLFWMFKIFGIILTLSSVLTLFDDVTQFKCKLKIALIIYGLYFNLLPIIFFLITNFPIKNCIFIWIKCHKNIFIFISFIVTAFLNTLLFLSSYKIKDIIVIDGENYKQCNTYATYGTCLLYLILSFNIIIIFGILLLLFLEWNLKETSKDTKYLLGSIFTTIFFFTIYIIFYNFKIKNYIFYSILLALMIFIYSISNFMFTFGIRIILKFTKIKSDDFNEEEFLKKNEEFNKHALSYVTSNNISIKSNHDNTINNNNINKINNYSNNMGSNDTSSNNNSSINIGSNTINTNNNNNNNNNNGNSHLNSKKVSGSLIGNLNLSNISRKASNISLKLISIHNKYSKD